MKTSLIQENSDSNPLQRTSSYKLLKAREKLKIKRKSRSKSRSKITNEHSQKVEAIPEVELEYKERSSNWSRPSLFNERQSIQELSKQKGTSEQMNLSSKKGSLLKHSEKST